VITPESWAVYVDCAKLGEERTKTKEKMENRLRNAAAIFASKDFTRLPKGRIAPSYAFLLLLTICSQVKRREFSQPRADGVADFRPT
jgi:hypothetical protein